MYLSFTDLENSTFKTSSLSTATPQSYRYVCNKNYTTCNGHCYYVVGNKKKDFNRAQEFCRNLNMSLISIHDKEENAFVQSILGDVVRNEVERTAWIGLKRVQWKAAEIGIYSVYHLICAYRLHNSYKLHLLRVQALKPDRKYSDKIVHLKKHMLRQKNNSST